MHLKTLELVHIILLLQQKMDVLDMIRLHLLSLRF